MIKMTTMTATTIPMTSPMWDEDDDGAAAEFPPVAPALGAADAVVPPPVDAPSSGFDVCVGAEASSAFSGSTIP